jgi:hypothetical protein
LTPSLISMTGEVWHQWSECESGSFIAVVNIYQSPSTNSDYTGIEGISIVCRPLMRSENWTPPQVNDSLLKLECPTYIVGFKTLSQKYKGCHDDMGIYGLGIICATEASNEGEIKYQVGDITTERNNEFAWTKLYRCPLHMAFCGIRMNTFREQGNCGTSKLCCLFMWLECKIWNTT